MDAVLGKNVTFKTLIDPKDEFSAIAWFFNNRSDLMRVVTMSRTWETVVVVSEGYQGRVALNRTNGFLTLGPLGPKDNGDYYVNIFTAKGVKTGETKLRVLGELLFVTSAIALMISVMFFICLYDCLTITYQDVVSILEQLISFWLWIH